MKEVNFHNSELISISPIDINTWSDRIVFDKIINIFTDSKKYIFAFGQRLYFDKPIDNLSSNSDINLIYYDSKFHDFIFSTDMLLDCHSKNRELITDCWKNYEHTLILFTDQPLLERIFQNKKRKERDFLRLSWKDFTKNTKSFVFFKGVEDKVVWIGKNSLLDFPNLSILKHFDPKLS